MFSAIAETEGLSGLRDEGMPDSALNASLQTFDGEEACTSLSQKASRLCFGLIRNHSFMDGNKQAGAYVMLAFLAINVIFPGIE